MSTTQHKSELETPTAVFSWRAHVRGTCQQMAWNSAVDGSDRFLELADIVEEVPEGFNRAVPHIAPGTRFQQHAFPESIYSGPGSEPGGIRKRFLPFSDDQTAESFSTQSARSRFSHECSTAVRLATVPPTANPLTSLGAGAPPCSLGDERSPDSSNACAKWGSKTSKVSYAFFSECPTDSHIEAGIHCPAGGEQTCGMSAPSEGDLPSADRAKSLRGHSHHWGRPACLSPSLSRSKTRGLSAWAARTAEIVSPGCPSSSLRTDTSASSRRPVNT